MVKPVPLQLLAWAGGAVLAALTTGAGAGLYGESLVERTNRDLEDARKELDLTKRDFTLKRQKYAERLSSYAVMINGLVGSGSLEFRADDLALPPDLKAAWESILRRVESMTWRGPQAPQAAFTPGEQQFLRAAVLGSPDRAQTAPYVAVVASLMMAKTGIKHAAEARKYRDEALASIASAKEASQKARRSLDYAADQLSAEWDNTISPNLKAALGPPRDEKILAVLKAMAESFEARAQILLSEGNYE